MFDDIFTPDKHWEKVYKIHKKTRRHSQLNICWMVFTGLVTMYFAYIRFMVESDVKCIAAQV